MKKKLLYFSATIIVLVISIFASIYMQHHEKRYHQHIEDVKTEGCAHTSTNDFCSNLPIVIVSTNGNEILNVIDDAEVNSINISIIDNSSAMNHFNDIPSNVEIANMKIRGNSSKYFDKKSYRLKFLDEDGNGKNVNVMNMGADNSWVLNGPFLDKTLIRNYMCMNISGEIMQYAPDVKFCELFIDEKYMGVYVMMESITRNKSRVDISGINEKLNKTGYILRLDRGSTENINNFTKYSYRLGNNNVINIEYPTSSKLTYELKNYIETDLSTFEKSLYSFDYKDNEYGYVKYIDISSFVDYFIINEFFINIDAGSYSTYLYKDIGEKLKLCVWDFNNSSDNYMERSFNEEEFFMTEKPWFYMLVKDEDFVKRIIWRYKELRKSVLSEEYLMNYIDETVDYLGDAIGRNYSVWGYSFEPENLDMSNRLDPIERNLRSYDEAITQLKTTIIKRGNWLDDNIDVLLQYCHESRTKKFNH